LTSHNGFEMARHEIINKIEGVSIYFTSYSTEESRSNENTNRRIRRHLPKSTNFNEIDLKKRLNIQEKLNNRLQKIIAYKTPKE
jgi:IS30 family transposase